MLFDGEAIGGRALPMRAFRRQAQMVFQDSSASLNPRMTIEGAIAFAPRVHGLSSRAAVARARDLLARIGLDPVRFAGRYPHEFSGGQRQRVNTARALALELRLVVLDEAVSALDKSVEAQVLNLLPDLKAEFNLTYVFISHDLNLVRFICDRVMVMYLGRVAEIGPAGVVLGAPSHPYTAALLSSMPSLDPDRRTEEAPLAGDPPNPIDPPPGCRFHPRCALAAPICATREPPLEALLADHRGACLAASRVRAIPSPQRRAWPRERGRLRGRARRRRHGPDRHLGRARARRRRGGPDPGARARDRSHRQSGSGKSVTLRALMRLSPEARTQVGGRIRVGGRDVMALSRRALARIRGREVAMIFQEPLLALDPVYTVGRQITEAIREHEPVGDREVRARALALFERVRIPSPERRLDAYPHEMSGACVSAR